MSQVEIVCHKGANEYAPENTYAAARRCIEWGVDYVEIDVNLSRDGVHYILHGPSVEQTTNGRGDFHALSSAEIDVLDAGSWFHVDFAGERVPRLEPFLRWIKGKAKVFLDVKRANLPELIALIYALGLEDECFFWFGDDADAREFRRLDGKLALKINVAAVADVARADEVYRANLVEVGLKDLSQPLVDECRRRGLRIMVYHPHKDPGAFRQVLRWGVDLINLDHGDLFLQVAAEFAAGASAQTEPLPRAKRVVLFMLDGCRPDALETAHTPVIDRLRREGVWTAQARTVMPSITLPCHTSLFYSAHPEQHGVTTNDWTPPDPPLPSLIEVIGDSGYGTAAFYSWEQLRDMAPPGTLDTSVYRRYSEQAFEELGRAAAGEIARQRPTFAFVYLEATDAIGHRYGWMSPAYLEAVAKSDRIIGQVIDALTAAGDLDETVCMVMADHGGHGHGHGTEQPEDMTIPWIAWGAGLRRNYCIQGPVHITDVAPTVLYLLGIPIPEQWQGQAIGEILAERPAVLPQADSAALSSMVSSQDV
ncbi:MAG: alkaline phosphatase family protein [Caldilineaceae bacterium]|nr:alkaline phosphatase family protein [Caldilineaceae bacterium]